MAACTAAIIDDCTKLLFPCCTSEINLGSIGLEFQIYVSALIPLSLPGAIFDTRMVRGSGEARTGILKIACKRTEEAV